MRAPPGRLMNRDFVLLWQGQFVSGLGSQAFAVAMMFWLKQATGSATIMGLVMMASTLPLALLSPVGGTVADRFSRRNILIASDLASGLSVLSLAALVLFVPGRLPLLLAWLFGVSVVSGLVRAFFYPAVTAAIPAIVPEDRVATANSLQQGSTQVAMLVGQGAGGVLFRLLGAPVLFLVDGVTYLVSALSEAFITIPQVLPERGASWRDELGRARHGLAEGLGYVWSRRGMRGFVVIAAVMNFFGVPWIVLLPFYVQDTLGARADWFGYLLAALGAGSILGYVVAGWIRVRGTARSILLVACLAGTGACMASLFWIRTPVVALAAHAGTGFMLGVFNVFVVTLLQLETPDALRGRVFGVLDAVTLGISPLAMALAGVAADLVGHDTPVIFGACGAVFLLTALVGGAYSPLRRFLAGEEPVPVSAVAPEGGS